MLRGLRGHVLAICALLVSGRGEEAREAVRRDLSWLPVPVADAKAWACRTLGRRLGLLREPGLFVPGQTIPVPPVAAPIGLRCVSREIADGVWSAELVDRFAIVTGGVRVDFPEITGTGADRPAAVESVAEQARELVNEALEREGREERWLTEEGDDA